MEKIIAFVLCCIPTPVHVINDRKGDNKKTNDILVLVALSIVLALIPAYLLPAVSTLSAVPLIKTLPLNLGIHTAFFDYWINYELYKNKVIERPEARRWWEYLGLSSKLDKFHLWVKIGWGGRLAVRAVVLGVTFTWFIC